MLHTMDSDTWKAVELSPLCVLCTMQYGILRKLAFIVSHFKFKQNNSSEMGKMLKVIQINI